MRIEWYSIWTKWVSNVTPKNVDFFDITTLNKFLRSWTTLCRVWNYWWNQILYSFVHWTLYYQIFDTLRKKHHLLLVWGLGLSFDVITYHTWFSSFFNRASDLVISVLSIIWKCGFILWWRRKYAFLKSKSVFKNIHFLLDNELG